MSNRSIGKKTQDTMQWSSSLSRALLVGGLFVGVALTLGCASRARITQFSDFATAGQAYIQAADKLIDEAASSSMDVSSLSLEANRDPLDEATRYEALRRARSSDLQLVTELFLIKKHNRLLNTYFQGLKDLAGSDASTQISTTATSAFNSLTTLRPEIQEIQIGASSIGEFVEPSVKIVVRQLSRSALEAELKERGDAIHEELELQRAAMEAISTWLIEMKKTEHSISEDNEVNRPYAESGALPADWNQRRREFLIREFNTIETIQKAEEAARKLRDAFASLSESKASLADLLSILDDANQVLTLLEEPEEN